ncbi:hypothetical protein K503DRAFT_694873 [Rhizopogon vinicolor AM-OR11-026]|uniref:Protein-S-isoprenylcysteine O-methyltransferase n=1 Tax=Rhizopogon vinicolor AM-OR11-026 TaxID=1314800 RepID=A0A1B7MVH8_9AGAM|nr:hypothetical protein K503DRAFT_694873 [Rhizopogon vinicolor AM-OR11-026]
MSLLKIPFILASALGIHWSFRAGPKPPVSEVVPSGTITETFIIWIRGHQVHTLSKISALAVWSVEVASILVARLDPSYTPEGVYEARAVQLLRTLHPTPITTAFLAGSLVVTVCGAFRRYCVLTLGKQWNAVLRIRKGHRLITSGPYSVVRHPSYTAFFLQYVGLVVMHGSQGSWMRESGVLQVPFVKVLVAINFILLTFVAGVAILRPSWEDKMLHHAFGEEWERWAKSVKYRLLPGVY